MREYENWKDKICAAVYGPGWIPGAPNRLGDINGVPEVLNKNFMLCSCSMRAIYFLKSTYPVYSGVVF